MPDDQVSKRNPPGSRYTERMARYYPEARAIPGQVAQTVICACNVCSETRILDIGCGTGNLTLQFAEISKRVTGIDVCKPFLRIAKKRAKRKHLGVDFRLQCAYTLVTNDEQYDLVVASQVLHWLSPARAALGIYRALHVDGALCILESKAVLPKEHPFCQVLKFGQERDVDMPESCQIHAKRHGTMLEQVRPGNRHLVLKSSWLFRERRSFDMDFARAYFFNETLRGSMPSEVRPWKALERMTLGYSKTHGLDGHMYWLLLQYVDISQQPGTCCVSDIGRSVVEIE